MLWSFFHFQTNRRHQLPVIQISVHSRADAGHNMPIRQIDFQTFYERPLPAHSGFDRMDGAIPVEENAVPTGLLGQDQPVSRRHAVSPFECQALFADKSGDPVDIRLGQVGAAISLTAITALGAFEQGPI